MGKKIGKGKKGGTKRKGPMSSKEKKKMQEVNYHNNRKKYTP